MRSTLRLLATIQKTGRYTNAFEPTGLTGVVNHPCPRPHLIYLYNTTLSKLASLPESSVYRQATEALTKQRLRIISGEVPDGLQEWKDRLSKEMEQSSFEPEKGRIAQMVSGRGYMPFFRLARDDRYVEYDGEAGQRRGEGPRPEYERRNQGKEFGDGMNANYVELMQRAENLEDEPPLTMQQISKLEGSFASGLLEEVIGVAERELELVDTMKEARAWEELEEKPAEGQWRYFERTEEVGLT